MIQIRFVSLLFICSLAVSLSVDDEDYIVEFDGSSSAESLGLSDTMRSGRLISLLQSPIIDLMLKTVSTSYVPQKPGDIFDFLRDSYPLPGGESCTFKS